MENRFRIVQETVAGKVDYFCPCNGRTGTDHLSEAWVESAAGLSFLCNWNHEYDTSGIRSYRF